EQDLAAQVINQCVFAVIDWMSSLNRRRAGLGSGTLASTTIGAQGVSGVGEGLIAVDLDHGDLIAPGVVFGDAGTAVAALGLYLRQGHLPWAQIMLLFDTAAFAHGTNLGSPQSPSSFLRKFSFSG